jgi:hypothetical protein
MSDADEDVQESGSTRKRRGQLEHLEQDTSELGELEVKGSKGRETDPGVKEVTRGVKVVELEDRKEESRTDGGKEAKSEAVDGESDVTALTAPLDPAHAPKTDGDPPQDVTATDDKAPADQTEAAVEAPANDLSEVEAATSRDAKGPLIQEEKEEATPEDGSEEVTDLEEFAESSPEP